MSKNEYGIYPDLSGVKRVLVIIYKNIGDVVLSSPVFSVLKQNLPDAVIDVAVTSGTEDVLKGNPNIDTIHVFDRKKLEENPLSRLSYELQFVRTIRSLKYDLSIALSTASRSMHLGFLSGAGIRVGVGSRKEKMRRCCFTILVQQAPAHRHYVERNLDCLRKIGIFPDRNMKATALFEGEEAKAKTRALLSEAGIKNNEPYIVFHPTSRWMYKCWTYEKAAELIDRLNKELNARVVLTSGPDSMELSYIKNVLDSINSNVTNFSGKLSLRELGALIRNAEMFIGVDSAPMHIAAAVKTPAVALFGPTCDLDWGPWGEGHRIITSTSHACRPCSLDGCGGSKRSECLEVIEVAEVMNAVTDLLN